MHHWIERFHPLVFTLTDGSGRTTRSRLPSTLSVLSSAGARPGSIFGRLTDTEAYSIIVESNVEPLLAITLELAASLREHEISMVVADALEGYNPSHDLCRYLTNAAILLEEQRPNRRVKNYDFLLVGDPGAYPEQERSRCLILQLDEAAFVRKMRAAENYFELKAEIEAAITRLGSAPFRQEVLRPAEPNQGLNGLDLEPPFYETYGDKQVAAGHYKQVIRYREHMLPLIRRLWRELGLPPTRTSTLE